MTNIITKLLNVPSSNESRTVEVAQLWSVRWLSRYGRFSDDLRKEAEFFPDEQEAKAFAESLRKAFSLIRHTSSNDIEIKKETTS